MFSLVGFQKQSGVVAIEVTEVIGERSRLYTKNKNT